MSTRIAPSIPYVNEHLQPRGARIGAGCSRDQRWDAHRHHGALYGVFVGGIPLHVVEHASQIRQFITSAGVKVQLMPGDRGYAS
jgi:hypothetical protein